MSDPTTDPTTDPTQATPEKKAKAKPATATIRLRAAIEWDGELAIGESRYPVVAGVVEVPAWHVDHATQAGFRPE